MSRSGEVQVSVNIGRHSGLADAAGGERRLVREVTVADVPSERANSVRDLTHEDAARRRRHVIERLKNLGHREVH